MHAWCPLFATRIILFLVQCVHNKQFSKACWYGSLGFVDIVWYIRYMFSRHKNTTIHLLHRKSNAMKYINGICACLPEIILLSHRSKLIVEISLVDYSMIFSWLPYFSGLIGFVSLFNKKTLTRFCSLLQEIHIPMSEDSDMSDISNCRPMCTG